MKEEEKLKLITMQFIKEKLTVDGTSLNFITSDYSNSKINYNVHNMNILNKFAYLGIYDYTKYLFLDFYEGSGRLYLQYFFEDEPIEIEIDCLCGKGIILNTDKIIYKIFELTIFSNKKTKIKEDDNLPF